MPSLPPDAGASGPGAAEPGAADGGPAGVLVLGGFTGTVASLASVTQPLLVFRKFEGARRRRSGYKGLHCG